MLCRHESKTAEVERTPLSQTGGAGVAFANVRERSQALSQGVANAQVQFHRAPTSTEQPAEGGIRGDAERHAGADRGHGGVRRFAGRHGASASSNLIVVDVRAKRTIVVN